MTFQKDVFNNIDGKDVLDVVTHALSKQSFWKNGKKRKNASSQKQKAKTIGESLIQSLQQPPDLSSATTRPVSNLQSLKQLPVP